MHILHRMVKLGSCKRLSMCIRHQVACSGSAALSPSTLPRTEAFGEITCCPWSPVGRPRRMLTFATAHCQVWEARRGPGSTRSSWAVPARLDKKAAKITYRCRAPSDCLQPARALADPRQGSLSAQNQNPEASAVLKTVALLSQLPR